MVKPIGDLIVTTLDSYLDSVFSENYLPADLIEGIKKRVAQGVPKSSVIEPRADTQVLTQLEQLKPGGLHTPPPTPIKRGEKKQ